jgi:hypothetical protein
VAGSGVGCSVGSGVGSGACACVHPAREIVSTAASTRTKTIIFFIWITFGGCMEVLIVSDKPLGNLQILEPDWIAGDDHFWFIS